MKKSFLLPALVIVAVGSALASHANKNNGALVDAYGINPVTEECTLGQLEPSCNLQGSIRCSVTFPDLTSSNAFQTEACEIELFKNH